MPLPEWDPLEKEWQAEVLKAAKLGGWLVYHTYNSKKSERGFPDLVLVRGAELIFAELKTRRGRVDPEQTKWLEALAATAAEVCVWRPTDIDEVYTRLTQRTRSTVAK